MFALVLKGHCHKSVFKGTRPREFFKRDTATRVFLYSLMILCHWGRTRGRDMAKVIGSSLHRTEASTFFQLSHSEVG